MAPKAPTRGRRNRVPPSTPDVIDLNSFCSYSKRNISAVINLSDEEDDDIKILDIIPKHIPLRKRKRNFEKGECSNSSNIPFVCEICTETKTMKEAFYISGCSHAYCTDCVANYISSKLEDNIVNISCPVPECKDCSAPLINDETDAVKNSECPNCNRMFCAQCKVPWHDGIECSEFQKLNAGEREKEDIMLMRLAQNMHCRRCPNCKFYVARTMGCNGMLFRCRCNFCYTCGAAYTASGCNCDKFINEEEGEEEEEVYEEEEEEEEEEVYEEEEEEKQEEEVYEEEEEEDVHEEKEEEEEEEDDDDMY